jgi:acyl carrier protein
MSEIKSKITTIIVDKLGVDPSAVQPEADFSNDLGADSLDKVEFIMDVEKEFGISIPDEEAEKLQTVGQAVAYLEKNVK